MLEFREVLFKPYRIIYEVVKTQVYVHCVLDGRRNIQDLLQERILEKAILRLFGVNDYTFTH